MAGAGQAPADVAAAERSSLIHGGGPQGYHATAESGAGDGGADGAAAAAVGASFSTGSSSGLPHQASRSPGVERREQFQANRQEASRTAVFSPAAWGSPLTILVLILGLLVLTVPPLVILYIEIRSWYTLIAHNAGKCDQELAFWLLIRNLMTLTAPRMPAPGELEEPQAERQRLAARVGSTLAMVWLVIGFVWTTRAKTCHETNPELYHWVRFLSIFGLFLHVLQVFFPVIIILVAMAYHGMVARGWIKSPNAASDDAIESMREVPYSPEAFGPNATRPDGAEPPPSDCCCCMENFGPEKTIIATPCSHYFHKECLKEWLKLSKTCPLCRANLDIEPVSA